MTELYVKLAQGWVPEQVLADPEQQAVQNPAQSRVCSICGQVKTAGLSDHWMSHVQLNLQVISLTVFRIEIICYGSDPYREKTYPVLNGKIQGFSPLRLKKQS